MIRECKDPRERANSAADLAIKYTLNHPSNPCLCIGLSPTIVRPSLEQDIRSFDTSVSSFADSREADIDRSAFFRIFRNACAFPFVGRSNSERLSFANLALDDDQLKTLSALVTGPGCQLFAGLKSHFYTLVLSIVKAGSDEIFWHVRALIMFLCFRVCFAPEPDSSHSFRTLLFPLVTHINGLSGLARDLFFQYLQRLPSHLCQILAIVQELLSDYIRTSGDRQSPALHFVRRRSSSGDSATSPPSEASGRFLHGASTIGRTPVWSGTTFGTI
jgi:hypothetical protein